MQTNTTTLEPFTGASVAVTGYPDHQLLDLQAQTDAVGNYTFNNLPAPGLNDKYMLAAVKEGYVPLNVLVPGSITEGELTTQNIDPQFHFRTEGGLYVLADLNIEDWVELSI